MNHSSAENNESRKVISVSDRLVDQFDALIQQLEAELGQNFSLEQVSHYKPELMLKLATLYVAAVLVIGIEATGALALEASKGLVKLVIQKMSQKLSHSSSSR